MSLYPKIDDFSILLDNDCKRMLRRNSKKLIICEVIDKLFNNEKNKYLYQNNSNNTLKNNNLLIMILNIFGCNKH